SRTPPVVTTPLPELVEGNLPEPASTSSASGVSAARTQPEHVDDVFRLGEAVFGGDGAGPLLHSIRLDLHRGSALAADEVVVVPGGAGAEQALALLLQRVSFALRLKVGERAVHGRQPDGRAALPQYGVQRLRAHESGFALEGFPYGLPLPRVALHGTTTSARLTRLPASPLRLRSHSVPRQA